MWHLLNGVSSLLTERTYLILIYKNEDLIETNKNTRTKLRFCNKNEDQRSILTIKERRFVFNWFI